MIREAKIEITNRCPLQCIHCSSEASPDKHDFMIPEVYMQCLRFLEFFDCQSVCISGGEPLLHPQLNLFVEETRKRGMDVELYTTGIGGSLPVNFQGKVIFSLYSMNSDIHDQITGVDNSLPLTTTQIRVNKGQKEIHFVPLSLNYGELPEICNFAVEAKVKRLSVLRYVPQGRGDKSLIPTLEQYIKMKEDIIQSRIKHPELIIRLGAPWSIMTKAANQCSIFHRLSISPRGEIYACDSLKGLPLTYGCLGQIIRGIE